MNKKVKSILQIVLFSAIGLVLVWLSIHNIPEDKVEQTQAAFKDADYLFVVISTVVCLLACVVRAWRWDSMLRPLGHSISFKNSFAAVMIGYVVNYAVPRAGELSRCGVAARYEKIPFTAALGTVVTERVVDVLLLLVLFFITLAAQFKELMGLTKKYLLDPLEKFFGDHRLLFYVLTGGFIVFVLAVFIFRKKISGMMGSKVGGFVKNFINGLRSVKDLERPWLFVFQSVLIWAMYFFSLYICLWCFPETKGLGMSTALSVLLFGTFGVMVSPGGLGAYPVIVSQVLIFYGVAVHISSAFPWIVWGAQFVAILITGGLCFILLPILNRSKDGISQTI